MIRHIHRDFPERLKQILSLAFVTCLLFPLSGCLSSKTIDVTKQTEWWGEFTPNETVQTKCDLLVGRGGLVQTQSYVARSDYHDEGVTVDNFKSNPEKWPDLKLLKTGTQMRCLSLKRYYSSESSQYILEAKILNGELTGRIVDLGWWLTFGGPDQKGSLRFNSKFIEVVK